MLKKLLMILLALCLTVSPLAGCGRNVSDDDDKDSSKTASRSKDKDKEDDDDVIIDYDDIDIDDDSGTSNAQMKDIVTFDFPDGWTESETQSAYLLNYQKDGNLVSVIEYVGSGYGSAWDLAESEGEAMKEFFENAEVLDPEAFNLDGVDAVRMDLLYPIMETMVQRQVYVYFIKGNNAYKILAAYFDDDDEGREQVEAILLSAKVKK